MTCNTHKDFTCEKGTHSAMYLKSKDPSLVKAGREEKKFKYNSTWGKTKFNSNETKEKKLAEVMPTEHPS